MHSAVKPLICASLVALALLCAASVRPQPAAAMTAKTPCWKALLNDWYDGRIDGTYPLHCYKDALKHLPADVSTYSSARDDIERALQAAVAQQRAADQKVTGNTLIVPPHQTTTTTSGAPTTTPKTGKKSKDRTIPATDARGRKTSKGLGGLAQRLNPSSPSSVPVPLLVLGGLGILLVAAGAIGLTVKRLQGRRPGT